MTFKERSNCEGCPLQGTTHPTGARRFIQHGGSPTASNERFLVVADLGALTGPPLNIFRETMRTEGFDESDFVFVPDVRCRHDPDLLTTKEKREVQAHCRGYLLEDINEVGPDVVIPMGAVAAKQAVGRAVKITKVAGVVEYSPELKAYILPTTSPVQVEMHPQFLGAFKSQCATLGRLVDYDYDLDKASRAVIGDYELVDDLQFLIDADPEMIAYDTEGSGLSMGDQNVLRWYSPDAKLLTMQFCIESGKAYMLSWDKSEDKKSQRQKSRLRKQFIDLMCHPDRIIVGQNAKFDALLTWATIGVRYRISGDTLMLAALLDENAHSKSLDNLVKRYVPAMAGYADRFNHEVDKSRMDDYPLDQNFIDYGCGDADATYRLFDTLTSQIYPDLKLTASYTNISLPAINAFVGIEPRGMLVDEDRIEAFEEFMTARVGAAYTSLIKQVPRSIKRLHVDKGLKFSRAAFVLDILFKHPDGFKLRPRVFTKSTAKLADLSRRIPSVSSKDHLPYFYEECPFTLELAQYIKDSRLLGTNVVGFKNKYIVDGMVRPNYRLDVTVTGRSSCVRGDTPVVTQRGKVRADAIAVGDMLWTHKGRWRKVSKLYLKPVSPMYGIRLSNGEVLTVTENHKVLLTTGVWATVRSLMDVGETYAECKQGTYEESSIGQGCSRSISHAFSDGSAGSGRISSEPFNGAGYDTGTYTRPQIQPTETDTLPGKQVSGEKSSVWKKMGFRLQGWEGIPYDTSRGNSVLCTSNSDGGILGAASVSATGISDSASHRRKYSSQQHRQSGDDHESRSCVDTRTVPTAFRGFDIEEINSAGMHRVYDFEVTDDHSYLACGVFSHNSDDPNGQNFPKRGEMAKAYRALYVAPEGHFYLEADESQAELRIAGDMANDPTIINIYRTGGDIHLNTACIVMGVSMAEFLQLSEEEQYLGRFKAKAVNFGFLYGMGWKKFIIYAKTQYGVEFSEQEARRIREAFFSTYYNLAPWHDKMRAYVRRHKYVRSYSGRVRHLPMIDSPQDWVRGEAERQAINSPVQEFASSLGLMAMAAMEEDLDPQYLKIVSFVHDANYALVPKQYVEWGAMTMRRYMETNPIEGAFGVKLKVPLTADVSFGLDLGHMRELKGLRPRPKTVRAKAAFTSFDWGQFWDEEKEEGIIVPTQEIPPNNGLRTQSVYTPWARAS